ncbi:MAG: RNA polymerase sigma-54 factor, partial [Alphaproteobacteria bacterium]|nr:RNA polymerase sigma-54 factor [Alphaproteobacteria bacterium]
MALSLRLSLKQQQSLVMTPQLQEAIKLLQMSNMELTVYVEEELEQNPLLERDEADRDDAAPAPESNGPADDSGLDGGADNPADSMELANADSMPAE